MARFLLKVLQKRFNIMKEENENIKNEECAQNAQSEANENAKESGNAKDETVGAEDTEESKDTASRWNIAVGYDYNLSKRTTVYTAAAYTKDSLDTGSKGEDVDPSSVEVMAGLIHRF